MPWQLPEAGQERLALAKGYPYPSPATSFLFRDGAVRPIAEADFAGRTPILAYGSNRAPGQLARKFGGRAGAEGRVPVSLAWLADYDVVYSAHVTRYGAIAASLHHAPGCRVRLAVTWLSAGQLARMHESEGASYRFGRLAGIVLRLDHGPADLLESVALYLGHGHLAEGDRPIGLSAVPAQGRAHRALTQEAALARVRDRHFPGEPLDDHILANIADDDRRRVLNARMRAAALPAAAPHFRPI